MGNSPAILDRTLLPAIRGVNPALPPAEAGTRFSDPRGMQG